MRNKAVGWCPSKQSMPGAAGVCTRLMGLHLRTCARAPYLRRRMCRRMRAPATTTTQGWFALRGAEQGRGVAGGKRQGVRDASTALRLTGCSSRMAPQEAQGCLAVFHLCTHRQSQQTPAAAWP